jgi:hypothetical protein
MGILTSIDFGGAAQVPFAEWLAPCLPAENLATATYDSFNGFAGSPHITKKFV